MSVLNRFRVDGMVAAVTGGASGIGLSTAAALAEAGAKVVVLDRDGPAAEAAAAGLGGGARGLALDVGDAAAIETVFARLAEEEGRLDILINNAGMAIRRPAVELTVAEWDQVVAVNMTGVFLCARAAAKAMGGRGGSIVNTASILGLTGGPYPNISYQTTKGAVVNMTRALALEWAGLNIRVNAIAPTWTRTPFIKGLEAQGGLIEKIEALTPMGRLAEADEIAAGMLFLASPAASMVTGHVLAVDGGYLAQ
jgi:NAD(P)-dependent dehydrogenase (short-subunit alcohol dehydrogenase family)